MGKGWVSEDWMEANMTCTTILFIQYTRHNEKYSMQTRIPHTPICIPHTPPLLDYTSHGYTLGHTNIIFCSSDIQ